MTDTDNKNLAEIEEAITWNDSDTRNRFPWFSPVEVCLISLGAIAAFVFGLLSHD